MNPFMDFALMFPAFVYPMKSIIWKLKKKSVLVDLTTYEEWLKLISWNTVDVEI